MSQARKRAKKWTFDEWFEAQYGKAPYPKGKYFEHVSALNLEMERGEQAGRRVIECCKYMLQYNVAFTAWRLENRHKEPRKFWRKAK